MSEEKKEPQAVAAVTMNVSVGPEGKVEIKPPVLSFLGVECRHAPEGGGTFIGHGGGFEMRVAVGDTVYATIAHGSLTFHAEKPTAAEAEKDILGQIGRTRTGLAILSITAGAPSLVVEAVHSFLAQWGALPPLVRAGHAHNTLRHFYDKMRSARREAELDERILLLSRRSRVRHLFGTADYAFFEFALALTASADAEAESLGIDQDVRYTGSPHLRPPPIADLTNRAETESLQAMAQHVAADLANEAHAAMDEQLGVKKKAVFSDELRALINKHSMENGSDTPDYALAQFMTNSLEAFEAAVHVREKHAGRR